jgi:hypothetical protein
MLSRQSFHLKQCTTLAWPHHENESQLSVNKCWSSILGKQHIAHIHGLITELLTTLLGENTAQKRSNTDYKIINIEHFKICKNSTLATEYGILIIYYYRTAKIRPLYILSDGPAGRTAENPPNSDRNGNDHCSEHEFPFRVYFARPLTTVRFWLMPWPQTMVRSHV